MIIHDICHLMLYSILLQPALLISALQIPWQSQHVSTSTRFTLQSIRHRGIGEQYQIHRYLNVQRARFDAAVAPSALYESFIVPPSTLGRISTLRHHSHESLTFYRESQRRHSSSDSYSSLASQKLFIKKDIHLPNVTDRDVVLTLAAMTSNCYTAVPHPGDWIDVDDGYNSTGPFGWDQDGLRGHVFSNDDNSSVIIAYKGTSLVGDTARQDKHMDNLLFSCCCARVSYLWRTVCDCYQDTYTCNMTCLENELRSPKGYYRAGLDIYHNVSAQYPKADIWLVGHSLGGAVASLVAQTYGLPAVTFQAPGERLAAQRLGLPIAPLSQLEILNNKNGTGRNETRFAENIWSFGHTADPLFMGTCGGITSLCWSAGFAMETHCHSGLECVYDVVNDFGWRQGVNTHRILNVIHDVISKYNSTPVGVRTNDCVDCFNWNG